jgi:NTP pyrophosphatase (non-canonical NTP hydrolase)
MSKITISEECFNPKSQANSFVLVPLHDPSAVDATPVYDNVRYDNFVRLLFKADTEAFMALHCAIGVAGEAGELADAIKNEYIYNKPRNIANVIEELGDLLFYAHATMNHYNLTEQEVLQANAVKLCRRYKGLKYSDQAAQDRADKQTPQAE